MWRFVKHVNVWLPSYLRQRSVPLPDGIKDVMFCLCDHFEPLHKTEKSEALARLGQWQVEFPRSTAAFRDADGYRPRHTLFYPVEQYDALLLGAVSDLCRLSGCEVEVHLHHDRDTPERLREKLELAKEHFVRHGLLSRDRKGRVRYGFVHGNWALCNSHPKGLNCGVDNELSILRETGCYADFTFPSAPDPTQTSTVNRLYYAINRRGPKSHDTGVQVRVMHSSPATPPDEDMEPRFGDLLIVQGPLGLNWESRKFGLLPRLENSHITAGNVLRPDRMRLWLRQHIHVLGRPEWIFIKVHTHGATPPNSSMFLGEKYRRSLDYLARTFSECNGWRLHWVTARELVNIVHAAEDGHSGNAGRFRDYMYGLPHQ